MEPMTLGSPVSSPVSNQSHYLPPFLMGDNQAMATHNNTLSPKLGRYSVSFAASPGSNTPQDTSYSNPQTYNRSSLGHRALFAGSASDSAANAAHSRGGAHTSHPTGPPTQGLFDLLVSEQMAAAASTPSHRTHLAMLQASHLNNSNCSLNQSGGQPPVSQLNDSYSSNAPNAVNASMRALCSPLGANMSPQVRASDFWVTIFGFAPGASSMILHHFTMCGTIVNVVHAPQNGNWMHVRYASRIDCGKALNYNQKVIASNVMVGVVRCTDEAFIDKENAKDKKAGGPIINDVDAKAMHPYKPKVRPLAQESYKVCQLGKEVSPTRNHAPQKSTGLMNKAMDLFFGW